MIINRNIKKISVALGLLLLFAHASLANGQQVSEDNVVCAVYLTGIGCGSCAVVDPVLFNDVVAKNPNLIIFEYEIFKHSVENKALLSLLLMDYVFLLTLWNFVETEGIIIKNFLLLALSVGFQSLAGLTNKRNTPYAMPY